MGPFRKVVTVLHRYFVPSEQNGYRPHMLQKAAAGGIFFLIVLTFTIVNIQSLALITSTWLSGAILPSVLIDLTNDNRVDGSLGSLRHNPLLDEAARLKAEDMAKKEYFAHDSPTGVTPWYWFKRVGYEYTHAGENLAVHFSDSDEVVKAWMKSPGHRANIMNGDYTEIGIGTAKGEYKGAPTIYVVQLFGRPMAKAEVVAVEAYEEATTQPEAEPTPIVETAPVAATVLDLEESTLTVAGALDAEMGTTTPTSSAPVAFASITPPIAPERPQNLVQLGEIATVSPYVARGVITIPVGENGGHTAQVRESRILAQFAVRPHMVMTVLYSLLAALVLVTLGISIAIEWRRHHPVQVAYGMGLVAMMWVAFYIHTVVLSGVLIA